MIYHIISLLHMSLKDYIQFLTLNGITQNAYIINKQGGIEASSESIHELPTYECDVEDE